MLEKFIKDRKYLFWSTVNYQQISPAVVLEQTLNYGDFSDVQKLFKILGIKRAATIFRRQLQQQRSNYSPLVSNYFKLYFRRYAS